MTTRFSLIIAAIYNRLMQARYKLTLFVTPDSSGKALQWLYTALSELRYNDYELVIVDVLKDPEMAKQADVIGTPALVYHAPDGDVLIHSVSDSQAVRKALGIVHL